MKVENLKELKRLIQTCQELGVKSISLDGITMELNERITTPQRKRRTPVDIDSFLAHVPGAEAADIAVPAPNIETDELSDEDLLFYSVGSAEPVSE